MRAVEKNTCNKEDCFNALLSGLQSQRGIVTETHGRQELRFVWCMVCCHAAVEYGIHWAGQEDLCQEPEKKAHVVKLVLGGLQSQAPGERLVSRRRWVEVGFHLLGRGQREKMTVEVSVWHGDGGHATHVETGWKIKAELEGTSAIGYHKWRKVKVTNTWTSSHNIWNHKTLQLPSLGVWLTDLPVCFRCVSYHIIQYLSWFLWQPLQMLWHWNLS